MALPAHGAARPVDDAERRLLTKVARMYHERGVRQIDIASALHVSQAQVSRLLRRATDLGIVRITVVVEPGMHVGLEEALEDRFHLEEALVIDASGSDADVTRALGSAGARYLESTLTGDERTGISSWSQTLLALVDHMRPQRRGGGSVVQLIGGSGAPEVQAEANRLLTKMASVMGASATFVPAPGIVGDATTRDSLLGDTAMRSVLKQWDELTVALVGVGALSPSGLLKASGNAVSNTDRAALLAAGAVGDVCHRFFDSSGALVSTSIDSRVVGIAPDALRAIPRRIGVAGGKAKHEAIRAAVVGGWINVLVTDATSARALLAPR